MRALLDLLVPPTCDGCGRPADPPWCPDCDDELRRGRPAAPCPVCAGEDGPGHPCWDGPPPVDALVTLGAWRGGVARAVTRAKLVGRREVLVAAGRRLAAAVASVGDVVVAVPSDRRRTRARGRDHTADLATGLGRARGVLVAHPFAAMTGTPDRVAGGGRGRWPAQPVPTIEVVRPDLVAGRHVVLVDDVVTTGATVAAATRALRACGTAMVTAAVVGRAGGHVLRTADATPDAASAERASACG